MAYIGEPNYQHGSASRLGILLVNLGTPNDTSTRSVRRYLGQFLSDPRVVEVPRVLWWLILHGVILRFRPSRTAEAYKTVWDEETGSPLLSIGLKQTGPLRHHLQHTLPDTKVALAMRYGNPSIEATLAEFREAGVRRILVLPLYPQYSGSTVASVFDEVTRQMTKIRWIPETRFINQYFDHPAYISALAESVTDSWQQNGKPQRLVMSFHGIPSATGIQAIRTSANARRQRDYWPNHSSWMQPDYQVVFQSRFGREPWLQPYCDKTMEKLPSEGIKHIDVICPGFSADCLETIEEINVENREIFMHAGGEKFHYIEALNDRATHIQSLSEVVQQHISGWPESGTGSPVTLAAINSPQVLKGSRERAIAMGASQ